MTPKEKKSAAVPARHESPSGAFKSQTGLRSKCCAFSTARSQRFRRAGADGLRHPASASCLGRHSHPAGRCPNSSSLYPPQAAVVAVANKGLLAPSDPKEDGLHAKKLAAALNAFLRSANFNGYKCARTQYRSCPAGRQSLKRRRACSAAGAAGRPDGRCP